MRTVCTIFLCSTTYSNTIVRVCLSVCLSRFGTKKLEIWKRKAVFCSPRLRVAERSGGNRSILYIILLDHINGCITKQISCKGSYFVWKMIRVQRRSVVKILSVRIFFVVILINVGCLLMSSVNFQVKYLRCHAND